MKGLKSHITRGLQVQSRIEAADNSGAKIVKLISVVNYKGVHGRKPSAGVGDMCWASVVKGKPDIRKTVVPVVIVRQKMPYRRADGMRISFEDNAVVVLKDEAGNPKGTLFKGPMAKEVGERWPMVSKIARIIV
ncbi:50S ribosomal protein L14 [Candidatus Woesearchaeota archaeon]|nr:50S ribosomal protein L14 [Candidatus Woesearchaeota archaeon]